MASPPDDLKLGALIIVRPGVQTSPLPLEVTDISGQITGPVASITVAQKFGNPFKEPLELEYLFPLPERAAIFDYEIKIGGRTIKADLKETETARRAYREALEQGKRASLLEERRPNLFSIQIGNVQPGEQITTSIRYEEPLNYDDGTYEFVFPMGITPRYHTPSTSGDEAASVDAPVIEPGSTERIAPVTLALTVDAGALAGEPLSRTHTIEIIRQDDRRFSLKLAGNNIANKDFVLRYAVVAESVRAVAWTSKDDDAETALISLLPPPLTQNVEPVAREFVFVIDRSGSMTGGPLTQAKNALRACLRALGARDTFAIFAFDDKLEAFDPKPRTLTQENVNAADQWLTGINGRGGTEILPAINTALSLSTDSERGRYVVFLTDGAVSAEDRALNEISRKRRGARLFTFGIGPSVNRALLNKMAELGRGRAEFLGINDDIEKAITRFQNRVSYPALMDIELKWHHAETWDSYPATLPDVYIGQPLTLVARFMRSGDVSVEMSGRRDKESIHLAVAIPRSDAKNSTIGRLWARARVESLLDSMRGGADSEKVRGQVISLALEHRLITPFTSFVAVDSEKVDTNDETRKVKVSVPLPEGLDYEGFFGPDLTQTGSAGFVGGSARMLFAAAPMPSSRRLSLSMLSTDSEEDDTVDFLAALAPDESVGEVHDGAAPAKRWSKAPSSSSSAQSSQATADPIRALARTQNTDGSWGQGIHQFEQTAASLLAFIRAGHTTRRGDYRAQVRKAVDWLVAGLPNSRGFPVAAGIRALLELDSIDQTHYTPADLPAPGTDAERAALSPVSVARPAQITTLDELRIAALVAGAVEPLDVGGLSGPLVEAWLAVGKRT